MVTDKIYSTLNGYIENFKELEVQQETNSVSIKAKVTVSPTRIVNFAKVIGGTTTEILVEAYWVKRSEKSKREPFVAKCLVDYFEDFPTMHSI